MSFEVGDRNFYHYEQIIVNVLRIYVRSLIVLFAPSQFKEDIE